MLQYIFSTTPILLSTYVSSCIDIKVSSAGVNMILAFLKKDIISGAKQLLWTERECLVSREEIKIYLVLFNNFAFLSSFTQKHMTFHLVKKCLVFLWLKWLSYLLLISHA